jgi:hypothetical protein
VAHFRVFGQDAGDLSSELPNENLPARTRGQFLNLQQGMSKRVGHLHQRPTRADVHGHRAAASRLDVKMPGLASSLGLAPVAREHLLGVRPFEYLLRPDQIVDEPTDGPCTNAHEPGQIGPRNWLSRADEVERYLPVDLTLRSATCNSEGGGTDSAHVSYGRL